MSQRRVCKKCGGEVISNYFDSLVRGLGKRGSTFADVDAITHDEDGDRWLFQEFKQPGEEMNTGQKRLLKGLRRLQYATVWCVRKREDGLIDWFSVGTSKKVETITEHEYRCRFARWWGVAEPQEPTTEDAEVKPDSKAVITAADIPWQ